MVQQAIAVIEGKNSAVRTELTTEMRKAALARNFERAARLRDQLQAMAQLKDQEQLIVNNKLADCDIIGSAAWGEQLCIALLKIRDCKIAETLRFALHLPLAEASEGIYSFLLQYYGEHALPKEIVLAEAPAYQQELAALFTATHKIVVPLRGKKKSLLAIATRNATLHLEELSREQLKHQGVLEKLQQFFSLPELPRRIECLDISHHQGSATVASIVCFIDACPSKADYRHYRLPELAGKPDDFKSIYQIMQRRLQKAAEGRAAMPELMVIDGGKGQLTAGLKAAGEFPELSCKLIALAKSKSIPRTHTLPEAAAIKSSERVFVPGAREALPLPEGSEVFRLLTHLRDEAHRFALSFHRRTQVKQTLTSPLEQIPGVGPKLRQRILGHFTSQEELLNASVDDLVKIPGISLALATRLHLLIRK
jgi:excinuclease ABC subunit C